MRTRYLTALFLILSSALAQAQDFPRGVVMDEVKTLADPAQSYSLYLPSAYTPDRQWGLLIAFHPGARGKQMVEKYRAGAEQYGYVVAGSNNSRNGPWAVSAAAAQAMWVDLGRRFSIDGQRIYMTGMSGGSRVAMEVALANKAIAGVIASSAAFSDSKARATAPFVIFGTAGTEDFNYLEMRLLDRKLTTPHRLAVFNGGHTLPPDDVALEAIDWLELQAMKSGRRPKDDAVVGRLFDKRQQRIAASANPVETLHLLDDLVADFSGLRDVAAEAKRAKELGAQSDVKKALTRERKALEDEVNELDYIFNLEAHLGDDSNHDPTLHLLRERLNRLATRAKSETESPDRSQARRMLRAITAGASSRVQDREYLNLVGQFALPGR